MHSDVVSRRQDFAFLLPKESVETVVRHFHFYATVAGWHAAAAVRGRHEHKNDLYSQELC